MKKIIILTLFFFLTLSGNTNARNLEIQLNNNEVPVIESITGNWVDENVDVAVFFTKGRFNGYRYKITDSQEFPTDGWSSWINEVRDTISVDKEGLSYLHIEARTSDGGVTRRTYGQFKVDKTKPSLSFSYPKEHKREYVLTVEAQDSLSGVKYIKTPDNNIIYSNTLNYNIFNNGTYVFEVVDNAGNSKIEKFTVTNIDRLAPNAPIFIVNESDLGYSLKLVHQEDIGGSGIDKVLYKKEDKTGAVVQDWKAYTEPIDILRDDSLVVKAKAQDKAGNFSSESVFVSEEEYLFNPSFVIRQDTYDITQSHVTLSFLHTNIDYDKVILPNGNSTSFLPVDYAVFQNGKYSFTVFDKDNQAHEINYYVNNIRSNPMRINTQNVLLELFSEDNLSGVEYMRLKNESGDWTPFIPYQTEYDWVLSNGSGLKYVWVQYKDGAGNESIPIADYVIVDKNAPKLTFYELNHGNYFTNNLNIPVRVKGFDALSIISTVGLSNTGSGWDLRPYTEDDISWSLTQGDGIKTVYAYLMDDLGNTSEVHQRQVYLDTVKPIVDFNINGGDTYTASREVMLNISYSDIGGSGVQKLVIKEDGVEFYINTPNDNGQMTIPWVLSAGDKRTVRIQSIDKAGNYSDEVVREIIVDNLEIERFTLIDVVNPLNEEFKPLTWTFPPQEMLSGANITFEMQIKEAYERDKNSDKVYYELFITNHNDYSNTLTGSMDWFVNDIYRKTITLPEDIPSGSNVYIKVIAERDLLVAPFDKQITYFPGVDESSRALIGKVGGNIREYIKFNETR